MSSETAMRKAEALASAYELAATYQAREESDPNRADKRAETLRCRAALLAHIAQIEAERDRWKGLAVELAAAEAERINWFEGIGLREQKDQLTKKINNRVLIDSLLARIKKESK